MSRRIRVAVVFGGRSAEHSVSLQSAEAVIGALDPRRFDVVPVGIARDGRFLVGRDPLASLRAALRAGEERSASELLARDGGEALAPSAAGRALGAVDVVFPVLHGPHGEDGTMQGLLELTGVPYVGAGVLGSAVSMDKAVMKQVFSQSGLPVGPYALLRRHEIADPGAVADRLRPLARPLFVKPANMGSSMGITRVETDAQLTEALRLAAAYDRRIVVEQAIDAREFECGVLGNDRPEASVVGEIIAAGAYYDFEAKYGGHSRLQIPAQIPDDVAQRLRAMAVQAFLAVDGQGMARVDFFMERGSDRLYVNEINTIPGFTRYSMFPLLWQETGLSFSSLCARLVDLALERADAAPRQDSAPPAEK